jgi:hypothetical protein
MKKPSNYPDWYQQRMEHGHFFDEPPRAREERLSKNIENFRKGEEAALQREQLKRGLAPDVGGAARPKAKPEDIVLEIAMSGDETAKISYLIGPWLPHGQVVGFFGRGETAKSSFVATLAAKASEYASTLWISTEEPVDWIKVRHTKAEGEDGSLFVYKALVTKTDAQGRATASSFNVYEHLEAAIQKAQGNAVLVAQATGNSHRPLVLVTQPTTQPAIEHALADSPSTRRDSPPIIASSSCGPAGTSHGCKHSRLSSCHCAARNSPGRTNTSGASLSAQCVTM